MSEQGNYNVLVEVKKTTIWLRKKDAEKPIDGRIKNQGVIMIENKIILIEDDKEIRGMINDYLSGEFEVTAFNDGMSAIQKITSYDEYALALIDLMLPDISGMEIIKIIRKVSKIPIIIITAKDNDIDKEDKGMADMVKRNDFLANEVVDLKEEIKLVSPTDTPLTTLLMGRGQVVTATDITVTWREKELNSQRGTLIKEGAEAGTPIKSTRGSLDNLCQIMEKVTQVSGTAQALNPKGVGNSFQSEVNDRLIETKRDMEWYFLNGTRHAEDTSNPRQMNGIMNLINSANVSGICGSWC